MTATTADIRRENSYAVVRAIHADTPASRRGVAKATGLSFATVSTICANLIDQGIVVESSRERPHTGRPTGLMTLDGAYGLVIGVDIAETYLHAQTFNAALEPLTWTHLPLNPSSTAPEDVVDPVRLAIQTEAARHPGQPLLGVGVSAPGVVDTSGGVSIFAAGWAWHDISLLTMIADGLDADVHLDNPLRLLAVAESWTDPRRLDQTYVVLNLGTGVGAGIVIDGRLFRGQTNSAGEWGHAVLVSDGRPCRCGSTGCVEAYIGAPGIIATLATIDPDSPLLDPDDQTATIAAIAAACGQGDPTATAVIAETARHFGDAVASIINVLNPEVVIMAGWVSAQLGDVILRQARPRIDAHTLAVPRSVVDFQVNHADSITNPVSLGAAALALERHLTGVPI
ncbi:MAG: ROK family protein [Propionibacteriaceae bacterium]|nr:ROK family protein [Propionibacteriaceae bacterium]